MPKTYGQFCGLARSLDHVGDRWTLLIIRELLTGDSSYGALAAALGGVPTNLLADRLRQLEADGIVFRDAVAADRRRSTYSLTGLGRDLEPVVVALIRWGSHWMRTGRAGDRFEPRWLALALRALCSGRTTSRRGAVRIVCEDRTLTVSTAEDGEIHVEETETVGADATVSGPPELLLAVASGEVTLGAAVKRGLRVTGDRALARGVLSP